MVASHIYKINVRVNQRKGQTRDINNNGHKTHDEDKTNMLNEIKASINTPYNMFLLLMRA